MHGEKMAACTVMEYAHSVLHLRAALETFLETANQTTNSKQQRHAFYDNDSLHEQNFGNQWLIQADPGRGPGRQPIILLTYYFQKTAWKWRNWTGGGVHP